MRSCRVLDQPEWPSSLRVFPGSSVYRDIALILVSGCTDESLDIVGCVCGDDRWVLLNNRNLKCFNFWFMNREHEHWWVKPCKQAGTVPIDRDSLAPFQLFYSNHSWSDLFSGVSLDDRTVREIDFLDLIPGSEQVRDRLVPLLAEFEWVP